MVSSVPKLAYATDSANAAPSLSAQASLDSCCCVYSGQSQTFAALSPAATPRQGDHRCIA